ncbi:p6 [Strawberry pallidosis-associated virus]|uniref:p6 n=1 Tax=Strawberry pallidosis-associated virus TaxID=227507 RepID=Q6JGW0_9CLOS|nr:p6 [Strawberry pallidosis-associated virus]AAS79677.1 p6 [Strawberry pallidosis-associated virus]QNN88889.1 p6 [Strawberry pallidosis-associated virus]QZN83691.1 p6 [Strawberry pallidosis-associated virus]UDP24126.1 p6 [Strawberry pallidosis-associated virus]UDP24134.1 p6 [Strawberry pallidosis-associated virus]
MLFFVLIVSDIGFNSYYLSDNKEFEGELIPIVTEDTTILIDLLRICSFIKERW